MVWYKKKWFKGTAATLALVGGAVHVLGAYNTFDLLNMFGGIAPFVQLLAGVAGVWVAIRAFK